MKEDQLTVIGATADRLKVESERESERHRMEEEVKEKDIMEGLEQLRASVEGTLQYGIVQYNCCLFDCLSVCFSPRLSDSLCICHFVCLMPLPLYFNSSTYKPSLDLYRFYVKIISVPLLSPHSFLTSLTLL